MDNDSIDNALEQKESKLYKAPTAEIGHEAFMPKQARDLELPKSWSTPLSQEPSTVKGKTSFALKFFLGAVILFIATISFAFWQFKANKNAVSNDRIQVSAETDPYIEGGEAGTLNVTIANQNTLPLEDAQLVISYEKGIGQNNESKQSKTIITLGTIAPQEIKKEEIPFTVYGAENEKRDIVVRLQYKVAGSNAIFNKDSLATVLLKSPPVAVHITGDSVFTPDDTSAFVVTIKNNTSTNTVPLLMALTLPVSFKLTTVSEQPYPKTSVWKIATLKPGEEHSINIRGVFTGSAGEKLTLKAAVGSPSGDLYSIDPVFSTEVKDIVLSTTGFSLSVRAETDRGDSKDLRLGDRARIFVRYQNTGSSTLSNASITLTYKGIAIDPSTVQMADNGYYDASRNTVLWNQGTSAQLGSIAPNTKGELSFFATIPNSTDGSPLSLDISADADNGETQSQVNATVSKTFPISGATSLNGYLTYGIGSFKNTGPLPPKAGSNTTYNLHMIASSDLAVSQAKVVFSLPIYVSWLSNTTSPNVTYDPKNRLVTWNIGTLESKKPIAAEIQIGVKPSQTHVGTTPSVTSGMTIVGIDQATGATIQKTIDSVTTEVKDPGVPSEKGVVVSG